MKDWTSQAHVKWECKYHVVILPKYRRKVLYVKVRRRIGEILRDLCRQKGVGLVEGKAMPDHIHMLVSVPPKYSIAMTVGYLKGKSAVRIHRQVLGTKGTLFGRSFWARGYCVSTVGLDEHQIRQYIKVIDPDDSPKHYYLHPRCCGVTNSDNWSVNPELLSMDWKVR